MERSLSKSLRIFFLATGLIVLSSILVIAFRVSGPHSKLEGNSLPKAIASLEKRMQQKIQAMNQLLTSQDGLKGPLFLSGSVRFEGQVFQATVSPEWETLPRHTKKLVLKTVLENYRTSRQQRLKQPGEPTIIFLENNKKVAVHTILEDIIR
ncbi:MAG: hypothetical protein M1297_01435 [Nitrospirae bacterium]|jgi:predicted flavoprotein YhiN|nr:hypothetical protein [Nitrospirota bacterium]